MGDEADFLIDGMTSGRLYVDNYRAKKRRNKTMMQTNKTVHTCPFCGNRYTVIHRYDDGYDYDGHKRGTVYNDFQPEGGCTCATAVALSKVRIKPMCLNCEFFNRSAFSCTNFTRMEEAKKVMKNLQVKVDVTTLKIVNEKEHCDKWRFDTKHVMNYITANQINYKGDAPANNQQKVDPKKLFRKQNGRSR